MPLPCLFSTCTRACTNIKLNTLTYLPTHRPVACPTPAEPHLCLASVRRPPLSRLISSTAEEVLQETTAPALSSYLASMSGAISSCRLHAQLQDAPQSRRKKAEDPDSRFTLLALVHILSVSGKRPSEVFKVEVNNLLVNLRGLFKKGRLTDHSFVSYSTQRSTDITGCFAK